MDPPSSHPSPDFPSSDFAFMAPVGSFGGYQLEYPPAHGGSPFDIPPPHHAQHEPSPFLGMPPFNYAGPAFPSAGISPSSLTPPRSSSQSGHSAHDGSSSQGEASASPGASPASTSTPPAVTHLSLSHHMPGHTSGNSSSDTRGSTGSMRYVVTSGGGGGSGHISSGAESRGRKRRATRHADDDDDSDEDDDMGISPITRRGAGPPSGRSSSQREQEARKEEIRKQRIESEQRRRDELREGYRRLKDVLPVSNQKSSKVSLLDRATTHIRVLEQHNDALQQKLTAVESELARLRQVNEALMLHAANAAGRGDPASHPPPSF